MPIKNRFSDLQEEIRLWRHELHEKPELLYDTIETASFVENKLKEFKCDSVVSGLGRTGVVGVIRGKKTESGLVIGLRADMDALPIQEKTGLEYSSKTPGVMHACGHDGHTAMLLGAAKFLAENRNFDGTVILIFQPAEEGGAGAKEMIEDGLIEKFGIQEVYGMHNMPGLSVGEFAIREGDFFAAADTFSISINGKGGHAAKPHRTVDPILVGSSLVMNLQTIASRKVNPVETLVISVCTFQTESDSFNVIPDSALLKGTVRTFSGEVRAYAKESIKKISELTAKTHGASIEIEYSDGYPVMSNTKHETDFARRVAEHVSGKDIAYAEKVMGAEDFSYMLNCTKGAYILIGNGNSSDVHNPNYVFDDDAIPFGSSYWVELIERRMEV
ncbi:MAG: M20 aminoacylase family protein [Pseudomonadota bacterium]|nr:M20 aminoacylase family protein [Pseudomonadota bacterium]